MHAETRSVPCRAFTKGALCSGSCRFLHSEDARVLYAAIGESFFDDSTEEPGPPSRQADRRGRRPPVAVARSNEPTFRDPVVTGGSYLMRAGGRQQHTPQERNQRHPADGVGLLLRRLGKVQQPPDDSDDDDDPSAASPLDLHWPAMNRRIHPGNTAIDRFRTPGSANVRVVGAEGADVHEAFFRRMAAARDIQPSIRPHAMVRSQAQRVGRARQGNRRRDQDANAADVDDMEYDELLELCERTGDVAVPARQWQQYLVSSTDVVNALEMHHNDRQRRRARDSSAPFTPTVTCVDEISEEEYMCSICLESCRAMLMTATNAAHDDMAATSTGDIVQQLKERAARIKQQQALRAAAAKELVACLPCGHCYHEKCAREWFERKPTCPVCKLNLNEI